MDRSFEVFLGQRLNEYSQEATRRRINWMCEQAKGRVLDVGCSQGIAPWLLGHRGLRVTGIDMDGDAIIWARDNLKNASPEARDNIDFIHADFLDYAPAETFDTILAGEYLEHLTDELLDRHLAHMARLLAPGGNVVVTVPLGLHPHPDHEQIFLPRNLAEKLGKHFSIPHMDAEDAYLRCVCDLATPKQIPTADQLLSLAEQGVIQLQQKANAGKRAAKVAELQGTDTIALYLRENRSPAQDNELARKLAAKGLWAPFVYDRYLFKTLNDIYADTPLVPQPREISPQSLFAQADKRVDYLLKLFGDTTGANCLEIGCGRGETAVRLAERGKCRVTGVDAHAYPEWPDRQSDAVRLEEVDLTERNPFAPESFDLIVSFAVLEHVQRPLAMLEAMFELLRPGGQIYFTANLHRGPKASHRYREVFFPWPHLLFEDAVLRKCASWALTSSSAPIPRAPLTRISTHAFRKSWGAIPRKIWKRISSSCTCANRKAPIHANNAHLPCLGCPPSLVRSGRGDAAASHPPLPASGRQSALQRPSSCGRPLRSVFH